MADETPAQEQQEPAKTPSPADMPAHPQPPAQGQQDDGKGGKDAILAELATERDKRQALEQQVAQLTQSTAGFNQLRQGLEKALGVGQQEQLTPEQLNEQLTGQLTDAQAKAAAAEQTTTALTRQVAALRAVADKADVDALLDSNTFLSSLNGDGDPAETAATFLGEHPRFLRTPPGAGTRDLNSGQADPKGDPDPITAALTQMVAGG